MIAFQASEQLWWYVARSGGIVALILTGLSVMWGLFVSTKVLQGTPSPKWLLSLHRFLGTLAVTFTGVHIIGLVADSFVHFGWAEVLVPFASSWRPGSVALGIVSMYLLIAVQVSSMVMKRIPRRVWKWIHMSSYGLFWTGLLHGVFSGTDAGHPLYVGMTAFMVLAVLFLTVFRILTSRPTPTRRTPTSAAPKVGAS